MVFDVGAVEVVGELIHSVVESILRGSRLVPFVVHTVHPEKGSVVVSPLRVQHVALQPRHIQRAPAQIHLPLGSDVAQVWICFCFFSAAQSPLFFPSPLFFFSDLPVATFLPVLLPLRGGISIPLSQRPGLRLCPLPFNAFLGDCVVLQRDVVIPLDEDPLGFPEAAPARAQACEGPHIRLQLRAEVVARHVRDNLGLGVVDRFDSGRRGPEPRPVPRNH
mmetsp:Transcript_19528/g.48997  ORF Transcript_19528/g.48997 Transcript_19528/m.48997 type:complete len:220 (-) Transcript_19528:2957-3616(-)